MVEKQKLKCGIMASEDTVLKHRGFGIRHLQMTCMSFCMIAMFVARSTFSVAILAMTDTRRRNDTNVEIYEWDKKTQGIILSSFFWGYMLMQIPSSLLAKRYGGKLILLIALIVSGLINLCLPTLAGMGGWMMVCACRLAMGFSQACLLPAFHTLLGKWLPANERTTFIGIVYSGSEVGTIIGMPLSGVLAETIIGWKLIFYFISGLMFATSLMWYWLAASSPGEHSMMTEEEKQYIEIGLNSAEPTRNLPTPWRGMFQTGAVWAIVAAHAGYSVAYILFFVDLPTYLERAMQISLQNIIFLVLASGHSQIWDGEIAPVTDILVALGTIPWQFPWQYSAFLSALPYFGMWFGGVMSASLCEKIYNKGLLSVWTCRRIFNSIALFGTGVGIAVLSFLGPEDKVYVIVTLVVVFTMLGFISAGFLVNPLDLSPNFAGVVLSVSNFIGGFGRAFTPVATSLILRNDSADVSRWRIVFLLVAAYCIVANLIYVIFGSSDKQSWDSPDYMPVKEHDPEKVDPVKSKNKEESKNEKPNYK